MAKVFTDRNGNELLYYNGMYWSRNFDRFWQLMIERKTPVMICRLYPGMNPKFVLGGRGIRRISWYRKWQKYGLAFFDPIVQEVYIREKQKQEEEQEVYYAQEPVSAS